MSLEPRIQPKILTTRGLLPVEQVHEGDVVISSQYGYRIENIVEKVEKVDCIEKSFIINDRIVLAGNQSIFANGNVTHVSLLKTGDVLTGEDNTEIIVEKIQETNKLEYWYRFQISGNHGYFGNGILLHNASRYLITGGAAVVWTAIDTSIWSASSGGATGASVPVDGDAVIMDGSSGAGSITLGYNPTVTSVACGAYTGSFLHSTFTVTCDTYSGSGTGARTINFGSGIIVLRATNTTILDFSTTTNLTFVAGTCIIRCTGAGTVGQTRTLSIASGASTMYRLEVTAGADTFSFSNNMTWTHINYTGFTGSSANVTVSIVTSFVLGTGMTTATGAGTMFFTGTGDKTMTSNGVTFNRDIAMSSAGNTLTLQDDIILGATKTLTLTNGNLNANNKNVTTGLFASSNTNTRILTMGSGTWTLTGTGTVWNCATTTNLTINYDTATIKITNTSASSKTFSGGGKTYYAVWYSPAAGTGTMIIVGSNTYTTQFKDDGTAAHTLQFTAGTTQTMPKTAWQVSGNSGALITLASTAASAFNLAFTGNGIVSAQYLSVSYCVVGADLAFYVGVNSTDGGNNTYVIFTNPPSANINRFASDRYQASRFQSNRFQASRFY